MPAEATLHEMPNGSAVYFAESNHAYYPQKEDGGRGRRCLGVTTPCKVFDTNNDPLLKWAARTGYIGVAELAATALGDALQKPQEELRGSLGWLLSQDGIERALNEAGLDFENVRNRAAKVGTNVHELALQAMAMGKPVPDMDALTDEEQGFAQAVMKFWLEHEPHAIDLVEGVVYSQELNVAGRLDLRCQLKTREGVGIIDAKTGFISESAHVQVGGGYPLLCEHAGYGSTDWALLLSLHADGTYDLLPARGTPTSFRFAVLAHREANRIKREARNDRERVSTDRALAEEMAKAVESA